MGTFWIEGCEMRRDAEGTIHIDGMDGNARFVSDSWDAPEGEWVSFCIHDKFGRCPGDPDVRSAQFGTMVRFVGADDDPGPVFYK